MTSRDFLVDMEVPCFSTSIQPGNHLRIHAECFHVLLDKKVGEMGFEPLLSPLG